jgi:histidine triad (HIT) family protein
MDCLFCKIIQKQIPVDLLYEDEWVVAFFDIAPQAPVHFLVIPKNHIATLADAEDSDKPLLGHLLFTAKKMAAQLGVAQSGARYVINSGADAGQTVGHLHLHVLAKRSLSWPPG